VNHVKLGDTVTDAVTGLIGTAVAITEYLNGCVRVQVQPPLDKDGKMVDVCSFDAEQLEVIGHMPKRVKITQDVVRTGGHDRKETSRP